MATKKRQILNRENVTCAQCLYALPDDAARMHNVAIEQFLCYGMPPTAQMVPVQVAGGGGNWVAMAARPPVKGDDMACSLFELKETVPKLAS